MRTSLAMWITPHVHIDNEKDSQLVLSFFELMDDKMNAFAERYVNPKFYHNLIAEPSLTGLHYEGMAGQWLKVRYYNITSPKVCELIGFSKALPQLRVFEMGKQTGKDFNRVFAVEFDVLMTGSELEKKKDQFKIKKPGIVAGCRIRINGFYPLASIDSIKRVHDYFKAYFKALEGVKDKDVRQQISREINGLVGE